MSEKRKIERSMLLIDVDVFGFTFSKRSAELATIERYAIFIENAEHGAAAAESAYFPDIIDRMTVVVHRHDGFLPFRLADVFLFGRLVYVLL